MILQNENDTTETSNILPSGRRAFFTASLPLPPGINASYKRVTYANKNGEEVRTFGATDALKQFKIDAAFLLADVKTGGYRDWTLINAIRKSRYHVPLKMDMHFYFKYEWKRPDIDACIKATTDAVFARLELNDVLVTDLHVKVHVDVEKPRVEIELYCNVRAGA